MEKGERHRNCDPEFKKEVLRLVVDVFVGCSEETVMAKRNNLLWYFISEHLVLNCNGKFFRCKTVPLEN